MASPGGPSASALAQDVGVHQSTLSREHDLDPQGVVLHSYNGGPMKGSTTLATLKRAWALRPPSAGRA